MNEDHDIDTETLLDEIARYLAVVELFRTADAEPSWHPEPVFEVQRLEAPGPAAASRVVH
jgi:hypothetical protein